MLTQAQQRTLHFIENYFSTHRHAPKLLEVAHGIGIQSKGTVSRYINTLIAAGYLAKHRHRHRGIQLAHSEQPYAEHNSIAILGKISPAMQFKHCHSMHIKDASLQDQGFYPGDTIWYQPSDTATENDIIMAYLDKTTPIIKRIAAQNDNFVSLTCPHIADKPKAYAKARIAIYGVIKGWQRVL